MEVDELEIAALVVVPMLEAKLAGLDREVMNKFHQGKLIAEDIQALYATRRILRDLLTQLEYKV